MDLMVQIAKKSNKELSCSSKVKSRLKVEKSPLFSSKNTHFYFIIKGYLDDLMLPLDSTLDSKNVPASGYCILGT